MPYKYKKQISEVKENHDSTCYDNYTEKECEAFRWTFSDIKDERNFLPTAFDETNNGARRRCSGYAISFHETEESSTKAWEYLVSDKPKKIKKIGTHMAKGTLKKGYGRCSESNTQLHFNFAEYTGIDLTPHFHIFKQLASDEMINSLQ